MKAVVVFESMYGNTRAIAEAIAKGIEASGDAEVTVAPVSEAGGEMVSQADLLVVGGPTHAHSMSRPASRRSARAAAAKPDSKLRLDPGAETDGRGVRDWLAQLDHGNGLAAAFDTRLDAPAMFTGRAATKIARQLRRLGFAALAEPESFLVTTATELCPGETKRAQQWGSELSALAARSLAPTGREAARR